MNGATSPGIQTAAVRLKEFQSLLNLQSATPPDITLSPAHGGDSVLNREILINRCAVFPTNTVAPITVPEQLLAQTPTQKGQRVSGGEQTGYSQQSQELRNDNEWQARAKLNQAVQLQAATNAYYNNAMPTRSGSQRSSFADRLSSSGSPLRQTNPTEEMEALNAADRKGSSFADRLSSIVSHQTNATAVLNAAPRPPAALPITDIAGEGVFKPLWVGSELVLARRVNFADRFVVQGVWLNWTNVHQSLVGTVKDLFPSAEILPVLSMNTDPQARLLASIPARLVPGAALLAQLPNWSPVQTALVVAWLCVLLAALAVAVLLHGTVSLSERRAAFVSAVTHELRTPLTTFKMYSEMLAEGMVPDETRRKSYLSTLCSEANRLSHLVENVLAYARLERGSARSRVERVSLGQLIERVKPRLDQRAAQADMQVVVDSDDKALNTVVNVDASAVEQILFNLVDNACKYAAPTASEKLIHLEALPDGKFAMLRVRDHGQGISAEGAKRLFQPFSKSADEAAHSAPGVGLGLALCRRLSRSMGGDLCLDALVKTGACFVLTLPVSAGSAGSAPASIA